MLIGNINNLKNKIINKSAAESANNNQNSEIISINNNEVLDSFGINNENIKFFEKTLPIKVFQKGNQLHIRGEKKNINILRNAIFRTLNDDKNTTAEKSTD